MICIVFLLYWSLRSSWIAWNILSGRLSGNGRDRRKDLLLLHKLGWILSGLNCIIDLASERWDSNYWFSELFAFFPFMALPNFVRNLSNAYISLPIVRISYLLGSCSTRWFWWRFNIIMTVSWPVLASSQITRSPLIFLWWNSFSKRDFWYFITR